MGLQTCPDRQEDAFVNMPDDAGAVIDCERVSAEW